MGKKSVILFGLLAVLILGFILLSVATLGFSIATVTDPTLWFSSLLVGLIAVAIVLTSRSLRKEKRITSDTEVVTYDKGIKSSAKNIINTGISRELDNYILELNKNSKYTTWQHKLRVKASKAKKSKKRAAILRKIDETTEQECWDFERCRYTKVTYGQLITGKTSGKTSINDNLDLDTKEGWDIAKIVLFKFIRVACMTGVVLSPVFMMADWSWNVLISILYKCIICAWAVYAGTADADGFVDGKLKITMLRRLNILSSFLKEMKRDNSIVEEVQTKESVKTVKQLWNDKTEHIPSVDDVLDAFGDKINF